MPGFHLCARFYSEYDKLFVEEQRETLSQGYRNYSDALIENILTYNGELGRHRINAVVGQTFNANFTIHLRAEGVNMPEPYYLQVNNAEKTSASTSGKRTRVGFLYW